MNDIIESYNGCKRQPRSHTRILVSQLSPANLGIPQELAGWTHKSKQKYEQILPTIRPLYMCQLQSVNGQPPLHQSLELTPYSNNQKADQVITSIATLLITILDSQKFFF